MRQGLIIVGAAILTRALMWLLVDPLVDLHSGDARYFLAVAHSIAAGQGHALGGIPTAFQAPGYAYFLALVPAPLIVQSLLTTLVGILAARRFNLIAALLYVTCPFLIIYEWRLIGESLAINLLVAAFLLAAFPRQRWEPIVAGVLAGLAILTRDTLQYLPLALLIPALFYRPVLKRTALVVLVAYLTVLPWQLRNGGPISEGRLGLNLWIGTWERDPHWIAPGLARANWPATAFRSAEERQRLLAALPRKQDRAFLDVAIDRIRTEPIEVGKSWAIRYRYLWLGTRAEQIELRAERGSLSWTAVKGGLFLLNVATLLAGLAGMVMAIRRDRRWWFAAVPILYIALVYLFFHNSETRYSLPAIPFLLAFAAYAATALITAKFRTSASLSDPPDKFRS